mgnify:CR=1 FL=1
MSARIKQDENARARRYDSSRVRLSWRSTSVERHAMREPNSLALSTLALSFSHALLLRLFTTRTYVSRVCIFACTTGAVARKEQTKRPVSTSNLLLEITFTRTDGRALLWGSCGTCLRALSRNTRIFHTFLVSANFSALCLCFYFRVSRGREKWTLILKRMFTHFWERERGRSKIERE